MESSTIRQDFQMEQSVAKCADTQLYPRMASGNATFRRIYDRTLQKSGVDVMFGKYRIDEKVKAHGGYVSKVINRIAFEISLNSWSRRGGTDDGWFIKDGITTDYYMLYSPFATVDDWKDIRFDNITKIVALLINRTELKRKIVHDLHKDANALRSDAASLWSFYGESGIDRMDYGAVGYLKYSPKLYEQPVNLVISRRYLKSVPDSVEFEFDESGVRKLP